MRRYYFLTAILFFLCCLCFGQSPNIPNKVGMDVRKPIEGLSVSDISFDRVVFNFDNMNTLDSEGDPENIVDQIRFRYRMIGTRVWSFRTIAKPIGIDPETGVCNSTQETSILINKLALDADYEWYSKLWYCGNIRGTSWVKGPGFSTTVR